MTDQSDAGSAPRGTRRWRCGRAAGVRGKRADTPPQPPARAIPPRWGSRQKRKRALRRGVAARVVSGYPGRGSGYPGRRSGYPGTPPQPPARFKED
eukprot:3979438-Pyramimonas_sp.AAC.1